MQETGWRPSAPIENLRARGKVLAQIRRFFAQREVLEVETPVLSKCAVSDPFIDSLEVSFGFQPGVEDERLYLQTSPEYAMKRLLAAGSGDIYQMAKVFRNGESGRRHNPEFTMLEWYRLGFDDRQLMAEVEALIREVVPELQVRYLSYADLFEQELGLDPHRATLEQLQQRCREHLDAPFDDDDRDTWLNLLMSHVLEPRLKGAVFIHSYPASMAALAQVRKDAQGRQVAARFELFVDGVELANGYHELTDAAEQARRLNADQLQRAALGLPQRPLEQRLVQALEAGIPECAGVALGVDRLVMLALGVDSLEQVVSFMHERA
ncbi:EF-P lysine aminoacylase EpmA [Marinobacterium sediminicola]|uniref:Lysyl-tRNA synthetase, class 2 n=1 Tax=Marinobacterium sediminicola TaxID=518898 RepID=A0ABY1S0C1_9GAMM|nr:EF-P lysine aminoacylase EpmA [Marinobacterium sediminicola]ULG69659.1 EF-P lysine aminoacylase GenX [Marinobacterium sediminicola]SMR74613.1 lysyl-tRNA synthetase, class 2 [Marinobacterium sediminicola]